MSAIPGGPSLTKGLVSCNRNNTFAGADDSSLGDGSSRGDPASASDTDSNSDDDHDMEEVAQEGGSGFHAGPPQQASQTNRLNFDGLHDPWIKGAAPFGTSGVAPEQRVVLEFEHDAFDLNGGNITFGSILNVGDDEYGDKSLRRQAAAIFLNMIIQPCVGGGLQNGGDDDAADQGGDRKDRTYEYNFKDPGAVGLSYPSYTIHYEEVPNEITGEPFKHRLWYLVWDPDFKVAKNVSYVLTANQYLYKDANSNGSGSGKKRAAARHEIAQNRKNVKTRLSSIVSGGELHTEFRNYFGNRSSKINNMRTAEYMHSFRALGDRHVCALENVLDPMDEANGTIVLDSIPYDESSVRLNPDQLDFRCYFDDQGRFSPPASAAQLFHTLHPTLSGVRDARVQTLPSRGDLSETQKVLVAHFARVKLAHKPELDLEAQTRSFEAYMAGVDHNPDNNTTSRRQSDAANMARYAFSSAKHREKFETKNSDGERVQINPFAEDRGRLDRLHALISMGAEKRDPEENRKLHEAARKLAVKHLRVSMEQRSEQIAAGTAHYYREGIALMQRLGSPFSRTRGVANVKSYDLFGVMINRFYAFVRTSLGAHEPLAVLLFHINSMAASVEGTSYQMSFYGPSGIGKSEMRERSSMLDLPGMNKMLQIQSDKSGLRNNHEDAFHVSYDEMPRVLESLKQKNKTAEQVDQINLHKKRITDHETTHSFPEETVDADGVKKLVDVKYVLLFRQMLSILSNGGTAFGVTHSDDNTNSMLNRSLYYPFVTKHTDKRGATRIAKDVATTTEREDIQKNQFLTRILLSLGIISPEFEIECDTAQEMFRRMDLADGRPAPDTRGVNHRMTIFKVFTAWFAVHCVFEFTNYHDLMPELFVGGDLDKPRPWSLEMMELCIPWLKTPNEILIQFVWSIYDTLTLGRGPVADEVMSLLVKEAGLKPSMYAKVAPFDKPDPALESSRDEEDRAHYRAEMDRLTKTTNEMHLRSVSKRDAPATWQHLATMYSEATVDRVLKLVQSVELGEGDVSTNTTTLAGMRKKEHSALGLSDYYKDRHVDREAPRVDFNLITLGFSTIPDLAASLSKQINRSLNIGEELIRGELYVMKNIVESFIFKQSRTGDVVTCESNISYRQPEYTDVWDGEPSSESEKLVKLAILKYKQFPAAGADRVLSDEKGAVLVSMYGASTQKSDKYQKNDDGSSAKGEFGLCVQHAAVKKQMLDEEQGTLYLKTHPQLGRLCKSGHKPLFRHAIARQKRILDVVLDMPAEYNIVSPFFEKNILEPIYVNTTEEVDPTVWSTTSADECPSLSANAKRVLNGKEPMRSGRQEASRPNYDKWTISELWLNNASNTLDEFGWTDGKWLRMMLDARTNEREHSKEAVYSIPNLVSSAAGTSADPAPTMKVVRPRPLDY